MFSLHTSKKIDIERLIDADSDDSAIGRDPKSSGVNEECRSFVIIHRGKSCSNKIDLVPQERGTKARGRKAKGRGHEDSGLHAHDCTDRVQDTD